MSDKENNDSSAPATATPEANKSELAELREEMVSLRESIESLTKLAAAAYRRR